MNHIYRLVWCRFCVVLVSVLEWVFLRRRGFSIGVRTIDRGSPVSTRKLPRIALMSAGGLLCASVACAQSNANTTLDDPQSLINTYETSHAGMVRVQASGKNALNDAGVAPHETTTTSLATTVKKHAPAVGGGAAPAVKSSASMARLASSKDSTDTPATASADTKTSHVADEHVADDADPAQSVAATPVASAYPLTFMPLNSVSAAAVPSLLPSPNIPVAPFGPVSASVPIFPTPSSSPTGLIVGNGGVVGTVTQLLGSTANSLFSGGNGYVTSGSLQVSSSNFSQGYSVVSVLGIPTLSH